jgi:tetratricopeptide (TPR) repeat protein
VIESKLAAQQKKTKMTKSPSPSLSQLSSLLMQYQNGLYDDAEKLAMSITQEFPRHPFGWKVLGGLFQKTGRISESLAANQKTVEINPKDPEAHYNLGITFQKLGRLDEAEGSYRQAIALKPDFAEAHYNLGITFQKLGTLEEARVSYEHAIALKPRNAEAYLNLCELLEKSNKLDEVLFVIKNAIGKVVEKEAYFLLYEALILFRKEEYQAAERLIKKIIKEELDDNRKISFLKLKADWHHYKKEYKFAFEVIKSMNKIIKDSPEYKKYATKKYLKQQREKIFQIERLQEKSSYKIETQETWLQPTFLIGFPRSGTTLLDTILRTHSGIDVVEEQPMLLKMESELGNFPTISLIEKIDNALAKNMSGIYLKELEKYCNINNYKVVIDKLPLNILNTALINRIFPQSKFILALRHPLDCIMSCWMQNFQMSPAMANMVDLDRIVDFYCTAMEVLYICKKRYGLKIHRVRYEDLVLDFRGEISNILEFLDLKWEDELTNYKKTALSRERIRTPSYSQVVKPIYNTASYRWKNYEQYLEPYKSQLAPWMKNYGYSC